MFEHERTSSGRVALRLVEQLYAVLAEQLPDVFDTIESALRADFAGAVGCNRDELDRALSMLISIREDMVRGH